MFKRFQHLLAVLAVLGFVSVSACQKGSDTTTDNQGAGGDTAAEGTMSGDSNSGTAVGGTPNGETPPGTPPTGGAQEAPPATPPAGGTQ